MFFLLLTTRLEKENATVTAPALFKDTYISIELSRDLSLNLFLIL